jgi:hypothetical protein
LTDVRSSDLVLPVRNESADQRRSAERLAEVLEATVLPVAEARPRVPVTAPSQERVVVIKGLATLGRRLPCFCQRAYLGDMGPEEWAALSDALLDAARACREQVVIDIEISGQIHVPPHRSV